MASAGMKRHVGLDVVQAPDVLGRQRLRGRAAGDDDDDVFGLAADAQAVVLDAKAARGVEQARFGRQFAELHLRALEQPAADARLVPAGLKENFRVRRRQNDHRRAAALGVTVGAVRRHAVGQRAAQAYSRQRSDQIG